MENREKWLAIGLALLAVVVVIISLIFKDESKEINGSPTIVSNYSDFYTVNSCLYRVVTYLSNKDAENMLLLINDDYKKKNNVDKDNVLNLFSDFDSDLTFTSKKMYYEKISNNLIKYYVYGFVEKNQLFDDEQLNKIESMAMYFIVYIDKESKIFSIEPYSGEIFTEGDKNEE